MVQIPDPSCLRLRLFGGCDISRCGEPLNLESAKARALLVYLASNLGPVRREKLTGLFWADLSETSARRNLRHSLWNLRSTLGAPNGLLSDAETVSLNPVLAFDLDTQVFAPLPSFFQTASPSTDLSLLQAAIDAYRGPFLDGFSVKNAPLFEEWMLVERERLHSLAARTLGCLGEAAIRRGDLAAALESTRRLLELEPWREEAHRQMMYLLIQTGQRGAALKQFETCRNQIQDELGVDLMDETLALYDQLQSGERTNLEVGPRHPAPFSASPLGNLPAQSTSFIGRENELNILPKMLADPGCRLITVAGPGGVGKTRLAIEAAMRSQSYFSNGAWFAPLAGLSSPADIPLALAAALGSPPAEKQAPLQALIAFLGGRRLLLVVDNFEHLHAGRGILAELLAAAPGLTLLVTSRQVLGIQGEHEIALLPLDTPDPCRLPPEEILADYPAIALFVDRVRQVRPGFRLIPQNTSITAAICALLDGLPLALELAAARARVLSLGDIRTRLQSGMGTFQLLSGGPGDLPARQQGLLAAIHWSTNLLSEDERRLFTRIGIFAGGCTFEALEALCSGQGERPITLLDDLTSLLDKSMLYAAEAEDQAPRYTMLRSLREVALASLAESGDLEEVQQRYVDYYLKIALASETELRGSQAAIWKARLDAEMDNFRQVFQFVQSAPILAVRLAGALWRYWYVACELHEGRRWIDTSLALASEQPIPLGDRARALYGAGVLTGNQGDYAAGEALLRQSLDCCRATEERSGEAQTLNSLGNAALAQGQLEPARTYYSASLEINRELGQHADYALTLNNLCIVVQQQGDLEDAEALARESLAIQLELGNRRGAAYAFNSLGVIYLRMRQWVHAAEFCRQSLANFEALEIRSGQAAALNSLGQAAAGCGKRDAATDYFRRSLILAVQIDDQETAAYDLEGLAEARVQDAVSFEAREAVPHLLAAARWLGAAEAIRTRLSLPVPPGEDERTVWLRQTLQSALAPDALFAALDVGHTLPLADVADEALEETTA